MRTVCLVWIGWFAAVGVTEATCTVFDILTHLFNVIIPDPVTWTVYGALAFLSGWMVYWVCKQSRDFREHQAILLEMWAAKMKELQSPRLPGHHAVRVHGRWPDVPGPNRLGA